MQSLKKIHAWAQMQDPLCSQDIEGKRNISVNQRP